MRSSSTGMVWGALLAAAGVAGWAEAAPPATGRGAPPGAEWQLPSCVRGSPPLSVPARAERAVLDAGDRQQFQRAAEARYPLYRRGGFVPPQVLLLRRGGHWQYVTLFHDGASGLCVTAVFAAERFDFTEGWLGKYQPREAEPVD